MSVNLFLVGTAGSGKTTLTKEFKEWMEVQGYRPVTINLDPGAENLPYEPDIDIMDWVSLREVMKEMGLGPNGAQIACADMVAMNASEVRDVMDTYDCDYFLIDTPGQMELFSFRQSSRELVRALGREISAFSFIFDPILSKQPSGFVSLMLLSATIYFRFHVPHIPLLGKSDLLSDEEIDTICEWSQDFELLETELLDTGSLRNTLSIEMVRGLQQIAFSERLIPVSSAEWFGMEDIYSDVQTIFFGGEDLEKS